MHPDVNLISLHKRRLLRIDSSKTYYVQDSFFFFLMSANSNQSEPSILKNSLTDEKWFGIKFAVRYLKLHPYVGMRPIQLYSHHAVYRSEFYALELSQDSTYDWRAVFREVGSGPLFRKSPSGMQGKLGHSLKGSDRDPVMSITEGHELR